MNLKNLRSLFQKDLSGLYPKQETDSFFYLLTEKYLKLKRVDIALNPKREIDREKEKIFSSALAKLKKEIPIQYILGETEFYGSLFKVDKNVLIPRPETEGLVEWILEEVKGNKWKQITSSHMEEDKIKKHRPEFSSPKKRQKNSNLRILDIGTGSGCIAITLARHLPNAEVFAMDISGNALKIAKENAEDQRVSVNFIEKNILKTSDLQIKFDLIVSNPPYVREKEKELMQNNVLKHEPHLALFVEDKDPLLFYRRIAELAQKNLNHGGKLFLEINQEFGHETTTLLKEKGFVKTELRKDIFGVDRMVMGEYA